MTSATEGAAASTRFDRRPSVAPARRADSRRRTRQADESRLAA
jgi:hypothetical protein